MACTRNRQKRVFKSILKCSSSGGFGEIVVQMFFTVSVNDANVNRVAEQIDFTVE